MKRFCILFVFYLLTVFSSNAQVSIVMEEVGGVYKIPCLVNGAKMKLVFDTGASAVCLSKSIAEYLLDNEYLTYDDFVGAGQSVVADGSVVDNLHLIIKDIEIEGLHLYNVEAVVIDSQSAPLLLGLSAINKLGKVELDGNVLTINSATEESVDDIIASSIDKATQYRKDGLYAKAAECYARAYSYDGLTEYGKYQYVRCLMLSEQFQSAKTVVESIDDVQWFCDNDINIYELLGWVNDYNDCLDEAIVYYKKAMELDIPSNKYADRAYYASCVASLYKIKKFYDNASKFYAMALWFREQEHNLPEHYLYNECMGKLKKGEKSYRDDDIDFYVYNLVDVLVESGSWSLEDGRLTLTHLAQNGNKYAIKHFNQLGIPYEKF